MGLSGPSSRMRPPARLRLTVESVPGAVFEPDPPAGDPAVAAAPDSIATRPAPEVRELPPAATERAFGRRRYEVTVDGWVIAVTVASAARAELLERAGQGSGERSQHHTDVVRAQIPGRVVRLWVAEGDTVEAGQRLLAIEAMKMENEVRAPRAGTVESIGVAVGHAVERGDELVRLG